VRQDVPWYSEEERNTERDLSREVIPLAAKADRTTNAALTREVDRGEADIEALEAEIERLEDQLAYQEFHLLDGYVVVISPVGDGSYIASCPTLHASVQENGKEESIASLREAVSVAKSAHQHSGTPLPPKDVLARCLD
jgi:hypothetical protein